ncbi:MAG: site-specific recombinase resolvase [Burkholderiaceae bacterium]|nr:site-specific recombinase resolvase [Aquabacterium sp.]NUP84587.1 site-specific recombinase resolvase [Burkholderiaceae bacterium]
MKDGALETFVPMTLRRRGVQRLVQAVTENREAHDSTLIEGMARAFHWQHLLDTGSLASGSAIARAEGLHHSVVNELLRLTLLAPDIVEALMAGRQPRRMTLLWFQRHPLPVDWHAQREIVRRFEERA